LAVGVSVDPSTWQASKDAARMLAALRGRRDERLFVLFSVACCRRLWGQLPDPAMCEALEPLERYAPGPATRAEGAGAHPPAGGRALSPAAAAAAGYSFYFAEPWQGAEYTSGYAARAVAGPGENAAQADLLRCIFGDPSRPVRLDPACRTPSALALAEAAYDAR